MVLAPLNCGRNLGRVAPLTSTLGLPSQLSNLNLPRQLPPPHLRASLAGLPLRAQLRTRPFERHSRFEPPRLLAVSALAALGVTRQPRLRGEALARAWGCRPCALALGPPPHPPPPAAFVSAFDSQLFLAAWAPLVFRWGRRAGSVLLRPSCSVVACLGLSLSAPLVRRRSRGPSAPPLVGLRPRLSWAFGPASCGPSAPPLVGLRPRYRGPAAPLSWACGPPIVGLRPTMNPGCGCKAFGVAACGSAGSAAAAMQPAAAVARWAAARSSSFDVLAVRPRSPGRPAAARVGTLAACSLPASAAAGLPTSLRPSHVHLPAAIAPPPSGTESARQQPPCQT